MHGKLSEDTVIVTPNPSFPLAFDPALVGTPRLRESLKEWKQAREAEVAKVASGVFPVLIVITLGF